MVQLWLNAGNKLTTRFEVNFYFLALITWVHEAETVEMNRW